jgi:hypothetical protein
MKYTHVLWIILILWLTACALIPTQPPTVSPPTPWVATATITLTPTPTPTPTVTPTPTPTATVPPPTPEPPGEAYVVETERQIGEYVVQVWRSTSAESIGFDNIATISRAGQGMARVDMVAELGQETGNDLTGEGHPDVVIRVFTGGAHCCFSTTVYDLGPKLTKVLETPLSNCDGIFEDLDDDGIAEYVTCDDLFAYAFCSYAGSPATQVILQYDPGRGYVPVSPRFAHLYDPIVARHVNQAQAAIPGDLGEWDGTTKCGILPLVLDYFYSGQDSAAWSEFSRLYTYPDALLFWAEITQAVATSSLYAPGDEQVDVTWPAYYMLQLNADCKVEFQQVVAVLEQEQASCDPDVPRRDIYWLDALLRDADLLVEGEMLTLAPEGCTDACRLDVIRIADSAPVGAIRLDTEVGFPGEVYRIDPEKESDHWRLRGDLTWERVVR